MKNLVDVVLMKDTSKRIIVMGDFNDLPETMPCNTSLIQALRVYGMMWRY